MRVANRNSLHATHQSQPFDYTRAIWRVADNICKNCVKVSHVEMSLIAVDYSRCKNDQEHGTLATLTALREGVSADGDDVSATGIQQPAHQTGTQPVELDSRKHVAVDTRGQSVWYLLTVFLPRFANLSYREKLVTIAHELWHVSDACDGRLRRFPGRCSLHGRSEKEFDAVAESIVDQWLITSPPEELTTFLHGSLDQLVATHGSVIGQRFRKHRD